MFSKNRLVTRKQSETNKKTEFAMTNEKLYENCKIVKLYEKQKKKKKTAPLTDETRM